MERLVAPSGAVIEARDDAVKRLLDAGFVPEKKPARRKPAAKKATEKE